VSEISEPPLCVDLDGTLIRGDLTIESSIQYLFKKPFEFLCSLPLIFGKLAAFKRKASPHTTIDAGHMPINKEFFQYLKEEKEGGRNLILVSASDGEIVHSIGKSFRLFDEIIGSDGVTNYRGQKKEKYLVDRFGVKGFDYAGNSKPDLEVWRSSRKSIVVNATASLAKKASKVSSEVKTFDMMQDGLAIRWKTLSRTLRIHQWSKNLLIFIPIFLAHRISEFQLLFTAAIAFLSFCFMASAIYLLNDIVDIESDRSHRLKRLRPIAYGAVSIPMAVALGMILATGSILLASGIDGVFRWYLLFYALTTSLYSFYLKRVVLVDIFVLASLYVLRILAGGEATHVEVSQWLLAFSMFMFLSLACVKRYAELYSLKKENTRSVRGRGYVAGDIEQISIFGAASGYISVVILSMYITSKEVTALYSSPERLWLLCPLMLYWVSRLWLRAHRGQVHEDPILFALRDKASYVVVSLLVAVTLAAM